MGAAIDAYGAGLSTTLRNPAYVLLAFVIFVVGLPIGLVLAYIPLLGPLLHMVVFVPFVSAIVIGMAYAGLRKHDSVLDAGFESLSENFLSLAGAYGILFAVNFAVWFVLVIVFFVMLLFGAASLDALESASSNPEAAVGPLLAGSLLFIAVGVVVFLVAVIAGLFLQFVDVAIVVGGESATSTFGAAWNLLLTDPLSVLGYTVLRTLTVVVATGIVFLAYGLGSLTGSDGVALGLLGLAALVVGPIAAAFYYAYHAAYYYERAGGRPLEEDDDGKPDASTGTDAPTGSATSTADRGQRAADPADESDPLR